MDLLSFDSAAWGSQELGHAADALNYSSSARGNGDSQRPAPASGGAVLVVGAGPAGLLAAHLLAHSHGCNVRVVDRRLHPGPLGSTDDDDDRAFAVAMNVRGMDAVAAAGLDVATFNSAPDMCQVRDTLLARGGSLSQAILVPFGHPRVVGSRQAFVRVLLHLVEQEWKGASSERCTRQQGGSLEFLWGASLAGADLAARTASIQLADGSVRTLGYDMLVGADGYWSKVRRAAEQQVPELQVVTLPPNRQYKVVRGLRPLASMPLGPTDGGKGPGRLCMMQEAAGAAASPGSIFFSQPSEAAGVTAVLSMPHARWAALGGGGEAQYRDMLGAGYPALPDSWCAEMAKQMASKALYETGMQVHASQLHGPSLVLLGDAAHAVSPATSNGMNSAMEDAIVLSQVLEACDGDLGAAPARYTSARLEAAQALLWLDSAMSCWAGRGGAAAALKASVVGRMVLHRASAGWVEPHGFVQFKDGSLPYAEARRRVERDLAVVRGMAGAGAGVALALVAAAAGRALRA